MKKLFLSVLASVATFLTVPVMALAAPTVVSGTVTINGHAGKGAKVTVTCNGYAKTDVADASGNYYVQFAQNKCPVGSTVSVTAKKGNKGGFTSKQVTGSTTTANVNVTTTTAVPEFGTVAAITAVAASGGAFMVIRRKQQLGSVNA